MTIRELNISARAKACLLSAGYQSVEEIKELSISELSSIRNLNEVIAREIRDAVEKCNFETEIVADLKVSYPGILDEIRFDKEEDEEEDKLPYVNITDAKVAYGNIGKLDLDFELWDEYWDEDDIKCLLQRDILLVVGSLYIVAGEEERLRLIACVKELFGYVEPEDCILAVIKDVKANQILSSLFRKVPYSIGLLYEKDSMDRTSESYKMFLIIEKVLASFVQENKGYMSVLVSAYLECCFNHLASSGIKVDTERIGKYPGYQELVRRNEMTIPKFYEVKAMEDKTARAYYNAIYSFITDTGSLSIIERSRYGELEETYTKKKYLAVRDEMQSLDYDTAFFKRIIGSIKIEIKTAVFSDEDDGVIKNEEADLQEKLDYIKAKYEKVEYVFGRDCVLEIESEKHGEYEILCEGTVFECIAAASKNTDRDYYPWLVLKYNFKETRNYYEHISFCNMDDFLDEIIRNVKNHPDIFDETIIPDVYDRADITFVDERNFDIIWRGLQKIEDKYRKGIIYDNRYNITDWESELCYEQGKYLENVEWSGSEIDEIPEIAIPYVTFSKMNKEQIRYYLYWRTCFRNGNYIVTGQRTYYYLYAYELMVELGDFTPEDRLKQFSELYEHYSREGLTNSRWVREYGRVHGLEVETESSSYYANYEAYQACAKEIARADYTNVFDAMNSKSTWKIKTSGLFNKIDCMKDIKTVIGEMMPKFEALFSSNGLIFADFLVGAYRNIERESWPYGGSIWTRRVLQRVIGKPFTTNVFEEVLPNGSIYITDAHGNIKRKTSTTLHYCDPYLSEFILRYTEVLFREYFGYGQLKWPMELVGALQVKFSYNYEYVLSVDEKDRAMQKKYISLYPEISAIVKNTVSEYFIQNKDRMEMLRAEYEETKVVIARPIIQKSPGVEEVVQYINDSASTLSMKELCEFYETTTVTTRKTKAKVLAPIMWDFWILHECSDFTYEEFKDKVIGNRWDIEGKKQLVGKDYKAALPYLTRGYDPRAGVVKKYFSEELILDCIILVMKAFDEVCEFYQVDSTEILLGKWKNKKWDIYDVEAQVENKVDREITVNLDDVVIYKYAPSSNVTIETYDTNESVQAFVNWLMKSIDNELRGYTNYKSLLAVEQVEEIITDDKYKPCAKALLSIISKVVKFVVEYNNPKGVVEDDKSSVNITRNSARTQISTVPSLLLKYLSVEDCIKGVLQEYYAISEVSVKNSVNPNEVLEIDLDSFEISKYFVESDIKDSASVNLVTLNLTRYYDIYDELQDRISDIIDNMTEYNPSWNYKTSKVMKDNKGLTGKDLATLTYLVKDGDDFSQWVAWFENGKFVIPKYEPYVQVLFHLAVNRAVFKNEPEKCLVMLSAICNYYFDAPDKFDQSADFMFEWLKHYWLIYCPNVSYAEFKKLLKVNVIFDGEEGQAYAKDHYLIDISGMRKGNLVAFYNEVCDYKVLYGRLIESGKRSLLEKALVNVHDSLEKLWNEYGRSFRDDIMKEEKVEIEKKRLVFYRCILLPRTKKYIQDTFDKRSISAQEEYVLGYDYDRMLPLLEYTTVEVSNNAGRYLLEYVLKQTEKVLREWLGIPENFKFSEYQLYEIYPYDLYHDNCRNRVIVATIEKAAKQTCREMNV